MKKISFILCALLFMGLAYPINSMAASNDEYIEKSTELLSELLDRTYEEFKNPKSLKTDDLVVENENTEMYLAHMDFYLNNLKVWDNYWKDYKYDLNFEKSEDGFIYFSRDIEYSEKNSLFYSDEYDATYKIKVEKVNGKYLISHIESTGFMFDVFEMIYKEKLKENPKLTVDEYLEVRKIDSKKLVEEIKAMESNKRSVDLEKKHREYNKKMGLPEDSGLLKKKGDQSTSYIDIKDHWAKDYIEKLTLEGHIKGYPDNSFKPDNNITYGEFVALFNRMYIPNYKVDQGGEFWYSNDFLEGVKAGYLPENFVSNGDEFIKRDEVAFLINSHLKFEENEELLNKFSDKALIRYSKEVSALVKSGVLEGYPDGNFNARNPIKRGEMAKILEVLSEKVSKKGNNVSGNVDDYISVTTSNVVNSKNSEIETKVLEYSIKDKKIKEIFSYPQNTFYSLAVYDKNANTVYYTKEKNNNSFERKKLGDQIYAYNLATKEDKMLSENLSVINQIIPVDNYLFFIGVFKDSTNLVLGRLDLKDGSIKKWSEGSDMATERLAVDKINKRVYVAIYDERKDSQNMLEGKSPTDVSICSFNFDLDDKKEVLKTDGQTVKALSVINNKLFYRLDNTFAPRPETETITEILDLETDKLMYSSKEQLPDGSFISGDFKGLYLFDKSQNNIYYYDFVSKKYEKILEGKDLGSIANLQLFTK